MRAPSGRIGGAHVLSIAASITLTVVYALGGQTQIEGVLLFVALGGIAVALVGWAHSFLPQGPFESEREERLAKPVAESEAEESFEEGAEAVGRRYFLVRILGVAVAALGAAAVFPVRSLGTRPGRSLFVTSWRRGSRLVTEDGKPVKAADVAVGTLLTVFPEHHLDAMDSQTVLIRVSPKTLKTFPGREDWAPDGLIAFSKVCTHAGCPVGLYNEQSHRLFCPCHQSVFDVLEAAKPIAGPAKRPLPQLPIRIDADGYLVAQSDFHEPIGPSFWSINKDA
jgi:ubiquinol-cytochrome c reductase iron-sulfur subunit